MQERQKNNQGGDDKGGEEDREARRKARQGEGLDWKPLICPHWQVHPQPQGLILL